MVRKYKFIAKIGKETFEPKGIYYQGKFVILVGDVAKDHTIRRKERIQDATIEILEENG